MEGRAMFDTTIKLCEHFLSKEDLQGLARAVRLAQDIHESSWISNRDELNYGHYDKSFVEAARESVMELGLDSFWEPVIARWCAGYWNDVQFWAKQTLQ